MSMRSWPRCFCVLVILLIAFSGAENRAQVVAPQYAQPTPVPNTPSLIPWFYLEGNGRSVWDRHRYYEDQANTVFILPWNFADISGGPAARADFLLINHAQFSPPEGEPAAIRRLVKDSLWKKSLQLYLNYSNVPINPSQPTGPKYNEGQMFVSQGEFNDQTDPPVPDLGFRHHFISGTRAALGVLGTRVTPFSRIDSGAVHKPGGSLTPNAVYVTASIGYAMNDIHVDDQGWAAQAVDDRLFVKDPTTNYWNDESYRIPSTVLATNNAGVGFADLNGDGYMDLYIGRHGPNYVGLGNVILIYNPTTGLFVDETSTRVKNAAGVFISEPACATTEVAVADVDGNTFPDLVVANRIARGGPAGAESHDYVLLNDGAGVFTLTWLGGGIPSDSRSVAVGNLDNDPALEIVFANAGSEGFSNTLVIPAAEDHPTQVFKRSGSGLSSTWQDQMSVFIHPGAEIIMTSPQAVQVLMVDIFGPPSLPSPARWTPDGHMDLVFVNYREILSDDTNADGAIDPGQKMWFLANLGATHSGNQHHLSSTSAFPTTWGKCAAIADIFSPITPNALDIMIGAGNRHSGVKTEMVKNLGSSAPSGVNVAPWGGIDTSYDLIPGTEHGYGFDFADFTGNGFMDALLTSRTYDYLVRDLLEINGHNNPHLDLTSDIPGFKHLANTRGKMPSRGMEDGCFFDIDGDGDLDFVVAAQRGGSQTNPAQNLSSTETVVVENEFSGLGFLHKVKNQVLSDGSTVLVDDRVSINGRNGDRYPGIADRVVAGDLDNDGDVDAIVHLFEIRKNNSDLQTYRVESPHFNLPNTTYSYGWRYLENIANQPGVAPLWLRDMAATKMVTPTGTFQPQWNRGLGYDLLGDFDNNGALDLFTTTGAAQYAADKAVPLGQPAVGGPPSGYNGVFLQTQDQGRDLIFHNGVRNQPIGTLVELSATKLPLPPAVQDVIRDPGDNQTHPFATWGASGACLGDIDNDGDTDIVVCRNGAGGRTHLTSLYVYNSVTTKFVDEFQTRVDFSTYSSMIHTKPAFDYSGNPVFTNVVADRAEQCIMGDIDGDGDLDLIFAVADQVLRCLRNRGADTNHDGIISSSEIPATNTFEDATSEWIGWVKSSSNFTDMDVVDVDGDGDLDICVDPFNDLPTIWRNDQVVGWEPRCTEIWPRVGSVRTKWVDLHGVNLNGIDQVELRYANGVTAIIGAPNILPVSSSRARVYLPASIPVGLAQVRVRRSLTPGGSTTPVAVWSVQYKGYFILLNSTVLEPQPILGQPSGPIQLP